MTTKSRGRQARAATYPLALKTETVRRHREEKLSIKQLAEELGAAPSTVRRWVDSSRRHGGPEAKSRHRKDCQCITCWRLARC